MRATLTVGRRSVLCLAVLLGLLTSAPRTRADEPQKARPPRVGRFISVPTPLRGDVVNRITQSARVTIDRLRLAEQARRIDEEPREIVIIFDFTPDGKASGSDNFGFSEELARNIRGLFKGANGFTIAYVHGPVTGHALLPILACDRIVLSRKAKLGPIQTAGVGEMPQYQKDAYRSLGEKRNQEALPRLLEDARTSALEVARAKELGDVDPELFENRENLAAEWGMGHDTFQEDVLPDRVVAWQIPVTGEVNAGLKEQLDRRLRRALNANANLILLELRCHGGDTRTGADIADMLMKLNNRSDTPVVTIAYVTKDAGDTAIYLAMGCNHIFMDGQARLGDFGKLLKDRSEADLQAIADSIEELARKQSYHPTLARAFVDKGTGNLFLVSSAKGRREKAVLTGREYDADQKGERKWQHPEQIPLGPDSLLTLDAAQAKRFGLSMDTASDVSEVYARYDVERGKVRVAGADWLDDLGDFIRTPWVSYLLVMVGITGLLIEMKLPGVGLPGVVAALCFVMFFWAHSQLGGQVTWLGILLFLVGLLLVGVEIFVLPGFGVCGISGIVLMVGSLALVAYGHWPQTSAQWAGLTRNIGPFGLVLMGSVVAAILLARYLPSIPFARGLILRPQVEEEGDALPEPTPAQAEAAALLGAIGVAATPLRPAGKVQFGEKFVDVVAEGSYVAPGTRVQVIEIEGNRVVVKEV